MSHVEALRDTVRRVAAALPVAALRDADQAVSDALTELWDAARGDDRQELTDVVRELSNVVGEHVQRGYFGLEHIQAQLQDYANRL